MYIFLPSLKQNRSLVMYRRSHIAGLISQPVEVDVAIEKDILCLMSIMPASGKTILFIFSWFLFFYKILLIAYL